MKRIFFHVFWNFSPDHVNCFKWVSFPILCVEDKTSPKLSRMNRTGSKLCFWKAESPWNSISTLIYARNAPFQKKRLLNVKKSCFQKVTWSGDTFFDVHKGAFSPEHLVVPCSSGKWFITSHKCARMIAACASWL